MKDKTMVDALREMLQNAKKDGKTSFVQNEQVISDSRELFGHELKDNEPQNNKKH